MRRHPLETLQIHPVFPAVVVDDADDDLMQTGDYISLKNYEGAIILHCYGDGSATSGDITSDLYQATDVAGSGAKVLNALETGRIYEKVHASSLAAVGAWTKVTQATADQQYDDADSGEELGMQALIVFASDLDVDGGFDCIRCDLSAISSAKLVCSLYILFGAKYEGEVTVQPSALAD